MDQQTRHLLTLVFTSAALLILALVAIHGIFFRDTVEEAIQEAGHEVFHFSRQDVRSFMLDTKSGRVIAQLTAEQTMSVWKIVSPVEDYCDPAVVALLADALEKVRWQEKFTGSDASDLRKFGLDKPAVTLVLRLESGEEHTIKIGSLPALDGTDYVMTDGQKAVFKTETPLRFALEKGLADLRSRLLISFAADTVEVIHMFGRKGLQIHLRKTPDKTWNMGKPAVAHANAEAVRELLEMLDSAKFTRVAFERISPERFRELFADPLLRLKISLKGFRHTELVFTEAPDAADGTHMLYARRLDQIRVVELPADLLKPFLKSPDEFRDRTLLRFKAGNVAAMELGLDDGMLELRRLAGEDASPAHDPGLLQGVIKTPDRKEAPGDSWLAKGLPGQSADKAAIHGFLDALASLRAQSFTNQTMPNLKDFGLDKPKRSWVLRGSTGGAMASLFQGMDAGGDSVWVRAVDGDGTVQIATVSADALNALPRMSADLGLRPVTTR